MNVTVLYEDQDIIVVEKPVGVPSQSDKGFTEDMVSKLKNYLYEKEGRPNPYVAVVHRLDRAVGGVMVYAKTKTAAADLSKQIQDGKVHKCYLTVVTDNLVHAPEEHLLEDYLIKDGRTNTSKVVSKGTKDAKVARLQYQVVDVAKDSKAEDEELPLSLLRIELLTGRHHQIRVQMAKHLGGVWGDTKYNPLFKQRRGWTNVALYAYSLSFTHPKTKKGISFQAYPQTEPFARFDIPKLLEGK